jgi:hypothetical protein
VLASTLERLTVQELAAMLAFRWSVASGGHQHPFAAEALRALADLSEGIPRQATILADNALLLGYYGNHAVIGPDLIRVAAADRKKGLEGGATR